MYQKLVLDELVLLDTADLRNYIDDRLEVPADPLTSATSSTGASTTVMW